MGATTPSNLVVLHPMMPLGSQRSQVTWQSTTHPCDGELSSGSCCFFLEGGKRGEFGSPSVGLGQRQAVAISILPYFYRIPKFDRAAIRARGAQP